METNYFSDEIGNDYTTWESGDIIMITAATGSGKTHFILHVLLEYVCEENKRMLYLVNRKILKKQLEENLSTVVTEHISIKTYQEIETDLRTNSHLDYLCYYDYCIYDECHYFYNDSNFNTYTELSFDFLRCLFDAKIQIFISATMENMEKTIQTRGVNYFAIPHDTYKRVTKLNLKIRYKKYFVESNYDYIDLKAIKDEQMMLEMILKNITSDSEKWLIFTDSIREGKNLKKKLEDSCQKLENNVVFIDARYKYNETANKEVTEISKNQQANKKIVITTSVMDNGISFHDQNLRNIVVMADTKESFIQMLGRKRKDGKKVTLYIFMRNKLHFQRRLNKINNILEFYKANQGYIKQMYTFHPKDVSKTQELLYPFTVAIYNCPLRTSYQQPVLNDIIQNRYPHAHEKLCYSFNGHIAFNTFSVERCMQLKIFYTNIIAEFDNNPNAFLIQQAKWLSFGDEIIEHLITDTTLDLRQRIEKKLFPFINRKLTGEDNKELKRQIKDDIKQLVQSNDEKAEKNTNNKLKSLNQNDRVISENDFNYFMKLLDIPFKMEKPDKSTFLITKTDNKKPS